MSDFYADVTIPDGPELGNTIPVRDAKEKPSRYTNIVVTAWQVDKPIPLHKHFSYLIYQKELTKTGREHFQAYIQLQPDKHGNGLTWKQLKDTLDEIGQNTAHVMKARGSLEDNQRYCTKVESRIDGPWSAGTPRLAGRKGTTKFSAEERKEISDKWHHDNDLRKRKIKGKECLVACLGFCKYCKNKDILGTNDVFKNFFEPPY